MTRESNRYIATESALAQLWVMSGLCDETRRFEGEKAALAQWLRAGPDCQRWIVVVATAGRGHELPPDLLRNKAYFNAHDWRIP